MKKLLFGILFIATIATLILGKIHWDEKVKVHSAESSPMTEYLI